MNIENCKFYTLSCDFLTVSMKQSSNAIRDCHSLLFCFFKGIKLCHKDILLVNRLFCFPQQIFAIYFKNAFDNIKWNDPNEWSSLFWCDFFFHCILQLPSLKLHPPCTGTHLCVYRKQYNKVTKNSISCCCLVSKLCLTLQLHGL